MDHIDISTNSSFTAVEYAKEVISDYGVKNISAVRLNTVNGIPNETVSSEEWPVVFECKDIAGELEIRIRNLGSGNSSIRAKCLVAILEYAGFIFDERIVYGKKFDHEKWDKL